MTRLRPRRSFLYMPGSNSRALEKGRSLAADGLILDLEDAVAPDAKEQARIHIRTALFVGGYGKRELIIRTNALNSPWGHADLAAMADCGADGILLPKIESADAVRQAESVLREHGAPPELKIWCMMETPRGILHAEEIADASPHMQGFVMGTSDLAKDLRAEHTPARLPFLTGLSLCLLAARAAGLVILDGVHLDLQDEQGFNVACRQGRELGMDGKTLIHPKTIDACNAIFSPTEEEIAWSKRIIEAHNQGMSEGHGVMLVDGKLIEKLHVENAQFLIEMAESIENIHSDAS